MLLRQKEEQRRKEEEEGKAMMINEALLAAETLLGADGGDLARLAEACQQMGEARPGLALPARARPLVKEETEAEEEEEKAMECRCKSTATSRAPHPCQPSLVPRVGVSQYALAGLAFLLHTLCKNKA